MFKKSFLTASLIGLGLSVVTAQASEPYGYLSGNYGEVEHKVGVGFGDFNENGFKLAAGLQANDYVAVEAQYTNLGKISDVYGGVKIKADTYGLGANVVGTLPIQDLTLFAKVGTHRMHTKIKGTYSSGIVYASESASINNWVTSFSAGAAYAITPAVEVIVEFDRYMSIAKEYDANFTSVGARYNF